MSERLSESDMKENRDQVIDGWDISPCYRDEYIPTEQELIEKAKAIYQDVYQQKPHSIRYETKVFNDNRDKRTNKTVERINEYRRQELIHQETKDKICYNLLYILVFFALFLIIGLFISIAVHTL